MKNARDLHKVKRSALGFGWMNSCQGFMGRNAELRPLPKSYGKGEWTSARARADSNRFIFHVSLCPARSGHIHIQKTLRRIRAVAFQRDSAFLLFMCFKEIPLPASGPQKLQNTKQGEKNFLWPEIQQVLSLKHPRIHCRYKKSDSRAKGTADVSGDRLFTQYVWCFITFKAETWGKERKKPPIFIRKKMQIRIT